jgi:hypothetical protein
LARNDQIFNFAKIPNWCQNTLIGIIPMQMSREVLPSPRAPEPPITPTGCLPPWSHQGRQLGRMRWSVGVEDRWGPTTLQNSITPAIPLVPAIDAASQRPTLPPHFCPLLAL